MIKPRLSEWGGMHWGFMRGVVACSRGFIWMLWIGRCLRHNWMIKLRPSEWEAGFFGWFWMRVWGDGGRGLKVAAVE